MADSQPRDVVFDEMHTICTRCGSKNREGTHDKSDDGKVNVSKVTCLDCGHQLTLYSK